MKKKIVYVEPGDMIEIRICDPVHDMGANAEAWKLDGRPASIMVTVDDHRTLTVPFDIGTFTGIGSARRQLL